MRTAFYSKLGAPFLVIAGSADSIVQSSDEFVQKAKDAGANIKYLRIESMDHYVRKKPDVYNQAFIWLEGIFLEKK